MKTYFTTRYGHPESPDGPDGEDTNFLVRARSVEEAAEIADAYLAETPTTSPKSQRPVEPFCHHIVELGEDRGGSGEPGVIHGPWIAYAILKSDGFSAWSRTSFHEGWTDDRQLYEEIKSDA